MVQGGKERPSHPTRVDGLDAMARTLASHFSGTTEADRDLTVFDDDGNLPHAIREFEHLLEDSFVFLYIDVAHSHVSLGAILTGRHGKGSPVLPIDHNFARHCITSLSSVLYREDDLAELSPLLKELVGLGRFREGKNLIHNRLEFPHLHQRDDSH